MSYSLPLVLWLVICPLISQTSLQAQNRHLTYLESQQDFPNPERGFYIPISTSSARFVPLDAATLATYRTQAQRVSKASYAINCSLVYRSYRLETFKTSRLSEDFLEKVGADFAIARRAGVKLILRFAYTDQATTGNCPGSI